MLLELGEPRVREGVWRHSAFPTDPVGRLRRTGLAAMMTVYGPKDTALQMIEGVTAKHRAVRGRTPDGAPYAALNPTLLTYVQSTALWGFVAAWSRYVRPLTEAQTAMAYDEAAPAAAAYGAKDYPRTESAMTSYLDAMVPSLEPSPIIDEFLGLMDQATILPHRGVGLQGLLVRAGIDLVPPAIAQRIGLGSRPFGPVARAIVPRAAAAADRLVIPGSPAALSCQRLGLPADYLVRAAPMARRNPLK